jgi:hypothetical protein
MNSPQTLQAEIIETRVRGVQLYRLPWLEDHQRGHLTVGNFGHEVPFLPLRYFITFGVPEEENRGEHAHWECSQFLICAYGSCSVLVDDGEHRETHSLNHPALGILVPPMVWSAEFNHSVGSRLIVFASAPYDPNDYIRDYRVFRKTVKHSRTTQKGTAEQYLTVSAR